MVTRVEDKISVYKEVESRRLPILDGISKNKSHTEIATELGVTKWIIGHDIRKMKNSRDPELKKRYLERDEFINLNKNKQAKKIQSRFLRMTGLTIEEKMFQNMVFFYRSELKKILNSKDENRAICKLPKNIRKTLQRNKIITKGWGKLVITPKARAFLTSK